jgi:hypothetical protein
MSSPAFLQWRASALKVDPSPQGIVRGLRADAAILEAEGRFSMASRLSKYASLLEAWESVPTPGTHWRKVLPSKPEQRVSNPRRLPKARRATVSKGSKRGKPRAGAKKLPKNLDFPGR